MKCYNCSLLRKLDNTSPTMSEKTGGVAMRLTAHLLCETGLAIALSIPAIAQCPTTFTSYPNAVDQKFAQGQPLNAKDRFQFWFSHLTELERAKESPKPEWQVHIDWSIQDHGPVETEIQKEWRLNLHIYDECICSPGAEGRKTAMKIAIRDAKAGDCSTAGLITVSTQLHNPEAIDVFHHTDAEEFCKYLKTK